MNFIKASLPYWKDGLLSLKDPWEWNDNHMLFGSTWFFILGRLNFRRPSLATYEDVRDEDELEIKFVFALIKQRIRPGLFNSFPSWGSETFSHDELLGLAAAAKGFAKELLLYGITHFWIFNPSGLGKNTAAGWMGRFPALIAYIYSRAGIIPLNPLNHVFAFFEFLLANRKTPIGETSGRCRRYLMADHFYRNGWAPMRFASRKYLERLERQYGTVGKLYAHYFRPEHPLTIYTMNLRFL